MSLDSILIVDDEVLIRDFLAETLKRKKYLVESASGVEEAFKKLAKQNFDLVITDMKMPDGSGIDILKRLQEHYPETLSIVITAFGNVQNAVKAMQLGAFNYIIKPFSPDTIEAIINNINKHSRLIHENRYLKEEVKQKHNNEEFIATSPEMLKIIQQVKKIAKSDANVFITGESGTGKELIAKMIHKESLRANGEYICINCAAIPETLIESELFGYERGAFTGANQKKLGRFELAHKGTLLLDEVTEIPIGMQAKLLRAIQEKKIERIGGMHSIDVNIRFISTSNRSLSAAIKENIFREDLFYRLNVIPIHIPPLRERQGDVEALANFFLKTMCRKNNKSPQILSQNALQKLKQYSWAGNVRELSNVIERAVVMNNNTTISSEDLQIFDYKFDDSKLESQPKSLKEIEKNSVLEKFYNDKTSTKEAFCNANAKELTNSK